MPVLEAQVEGPVCKAAYDLYGVLNIKLYMPGWPDRLFLIPGGKVLFIEFKRPNGGVVSKIQIHIHKLLTTFGFDVQIHDSKKEALQAIARKLET